MPRHLSFSRSLRITAFLLGMGVVVWQTATPRGVLHAGVRTLYRRWRSGRQEAVRARLAQAEALEAQRTDLDVTIRIDPHADRHLISPFIYGVAHAPSDPAALKALGIGLHRWGGNANTRHNWVMNAWNPARDWRFQNGGDPQPRRAAEVADAFVAANRAAQVATLFTIPAMGWVARDRDPMKRSVMVPAHGAPPLVMGETSGGITGYDPATNRLRTCVVSRAKKAEPFQLLPHPTPGATVYQDEFVAHLVQRFGSAKQGGVRFYAIDNEPDLWSETHTDIHPARMDYDAMRTMFIEYATAIKAVDPAAQVTGPVLSGWTSYFYSALDAGEDNFATHDDRRRHGDLPFVLWFLQQVRDHDRRVGYRTLDVLDIHYYPQATGVFSAQADEKTRALRLRSVRAWTDPNYVDESWIAEPVRLIPRLKEWIAQGYPDTKLGITEWNFGGEEDISGALATAETLGVFGREGIYLASYWTSPKQGTPTARAFQLLHQSGGGLGDISCRAISTTPEQVSAFAAIDSRTGELTLLLVNKHPRALAHLQIRLATGQAGASGDAWQLSAMHPREIRRTVSPTWHQGQARLTVPPYSATLVRFSLVTDNEES